IVVEGVEAGGHLGTDKKVKSILKKIKDKINLPVIAAGDIVTTEDIRYMFAAGLDGVQMGTRFLLSKESDVSDVFKDLCVKAKKEDIFEIMSSVGLKANALKTRFSKLVKAGQAPEPEACNDCLKHCTKEFCIKEALLRGRKGDKENGIFFTGKGVCKIKEVLSVKDIFKRIKKLKDDVKNYARAF
ncbi:MAG: NAD(P)H-dependent flavin oxidoreductase, partial [Bacillota bacterium]